MPRLHMAALEAIPLSTSPPFPGEAQYLITAYTAAYTYAPAKDICDKVTT